MSTADETFVKNLEEKTGKSVAEWIKVVEKSRIEKHAQIIAMLKSDHGFTHGYANFIALKARKSDAGSAEDSTALIDDQYKGEKGALRPIYDDLVKKIGQFGNDVTFEPKKAYVSVRRKKQFALIQPTTKTRVDIGINLKGKSAAGRLEPSGSNSMCSHRVRVTERLEIDREIIDWLREAYDSAG